MVYHYQMWLMIKGIIQKSSRHVWIFIKVTCKPFLYALWVPRSKIQFHFRVHLSFLQFSFRYWKDIFAHLLACFTNLTSDDDWLYECYETLKSFQWILSIWYIVIDIKFFTSFVKLFFSILISNVFIIQIEYHRLMLNGRNMGHVIYPTRFCI